MCDGEHVRCRDEDPCMITSTVCACAGHAAMECVMVNMLEGGIEDSCMITSIVCACAGHAAMECVMVNMLEGGTRILV